MNDDMNDEYWDIYEKSKKKLYIGLMTRSIYLLLIR